jgi:regulator of telomere elongation helicase 1
MEDLVSAGKQFRVCPFYYTRGLIAGAEIIFVPYNYLFDRDARESTLAEVDFANSVLIFDEAHNLEEFASESSSFDLNSGDVAGCVGEVQRALQYLELNPDSTTGGGNQLKDNMLRLKSIFLKLEQYLLNGISSNAIANAASSGESSHSGEFIFDIFREGAGITHANSGIFIAFVRQVQDLIMEFKGSSSSSGTPRLDHFGRYRASSLSCRAFCDRTHFNSIFSQLHKANLWNRNRTASTGACEIVSGAYNKSQWQYRWWIRRR